MRRPWFLLSLAACATGAGPRPEARPNVVLILTDDQGYADVGAFGARGFRTPNLDRLAREGRRFTDFYVAQAVCTASRAALMTGCYPNRVGLQGALNHKSTVGIHGEETLLPEIFKSRGYATAAFGKWHLGHHPKFLPTAGAWRKYVVPFERVGAGGAQVYGLVVMDLTGEAQPPIFFDDIALLPTLPPPAGPR